MSEYIVQDTTLTNIANAIRSKTGNSNSITVPNMANEISNISTKSDLSFITAGAEQILSGYFGSDNEGNPIEGMLSPSKVSLITTTPTHGYFYANYGAWTNRYFSGYEINFTTSFIPNGLIIPMGSTQSSSDGTLTCEVSLFIINNKQYGVTFYSRNCNLNNGASYMVSVNNSTPESLGSVNNQRNIILPETTQFNIKVCNFDSSFFQYPSIYETTVIAFRI